MTRSVDDEATIYHAQTNLLISGPSTTLQQRTRAKKKKKNSPSTRPDPSQRGLLIQNQTNSRKEAK